MRLEEISLETCEILNIHEACEDLDLLGDSRLKAQQTTIIGGTLVGGKWRVFDGSRRVGAVVHARLDWPPPAGSACEAAEAAAAVGFPGGLGSAFVREE